MEVFFFKTKFNLILTQVITAIFKALVDFQPGSDLIIMRQYFVFDTRNY